MEEYNDLKVAVIKCPYCGEVLPPLSKVCPSCNQIVDSQNEADNVNNMMTEIDTICSKYLNTNIRVYDYLLLLIPIVYIVWFFVVIMKIMRSKALYNDFCSLSSKAQTLYGDNYSFRSYLGQKRTDMQELMRKSKKSHIIVYIIMSVNILLLVISLAS